MAHQDKYFMPEGFIPSQDDVVIGRGKKIIARNARFHKIIEQYMGSYSAATSRSLKSAILVRVLQHVKEKVGGRFVKKEGKRWLEVEDSLARTTIAQALRDALHTSYRSSKQFKQLRRQKSKTESPEVAPTSMVGALRMASCQGRSEYPSQEDMLPFHKLGNARSTEPPRNMKALQEILSEANGILDAPDLLGGPSLEDGMESLDGVFSSSEIAAACNEELEVSPSLFNPLDTNQMYSEASNLDLEPSTSMAPSFTVQDETAEDLDDLDVSEMFRYFAL